MTLELLKTATAKLAREVPVVNHWTNVYDGKAAPGYIDPDILRAFGNRVKPLVANLAIPAIGVLVENEEVAGFRTAAATSSDVVDNDLMTLWDEMDMRSLSPMAHLEAHITGRAFYMVGAAPDGSPLATVESPRQMTLVRDPATGTPLAALKRYREADGTVISVVMTPDAVDTYVSVGADSMLSDISPEIGADTKLASSVANPLGRIPVVMLPNNPRVGLPDGISDIAAYEDILIALAKLGSDLMLASERSALPQRIVTTGSELTQEQAETIKARMSRSMTDSTAAHVGVLGGGAQVQEMGVASLGNYDLGIRLLTSLFATVSGLPAHYVFGDSANPTSADALRASAARTTAAVKARQQWWSRPYADLMRLAQLVRDGYADPRLDSLTTLWTDPTPASVGQMGDYLAKMTAAGILDRRAALTSLDLDPLEVERVLSTTPGIA